MDAILAAAPPVLCKIAVSVAVGVGGLLLIYATDRWLRRRDVRRLEVQQQIRDMEEHIREESLPDEARERRRQERAREAAIHREARRRLGLPEKD